MTGSVRLADLTRGSVATRAPTALAVLPVGACEQHGPHLPLGTDFRVVEYVAVAAAERLAGSVDVLVAPVVPFGFSPYHLATGATVTITSRTLGAYLSEACASLVRSGFRRVFVLNGHGGNSDLTNVVVRDLAVDQPVLAAAGSYWTIAWDRLIEDGAQEDGRLPGHAGAFETSLVMALLPDQVDSPPDRPRPFTSNPRGAHHPYLIEDQRQWVDSDGFSDNPTAADPEHGRRWLEIVVESVATAFGEMAARPLD